MSVPSRFARAAPNAGQVPEVLTPYPRPARASVPPPNFEFARHWANNPSSGRMSVAAVFTSKVPLVNRALTVAGGVESEELSPQSEELTRLAGTGKELMFTLQCGWAK